MWRVDRADAETPRRYLAFGWSNHGTVPEGVPGLPAGQGDTGHSGGGPPSGHSSGVFCGTQF